MTIQTTRRHCLLEAGAIALLSGGYTWSRFQRAVRSAKDRVSSKSSLIRTPFGLLEYAVAGSGSSILMIHGSGGGFDQGLRFGAALQRRGHSIIAPVRFGYLRSDFPAYPSVANQADAFVTLLDHLGIYRLTVVGGSAGALSATAFALRHPERCTALVLLVPAANVSGSDPVEMTALQQKAVRVLVNSDFAYWSALGAAPKTLIGMLLATDPALLATVNASERQRAFAILNDMLPIHARSKGMLNDARQAGHPAKMDFSQVKMPVLVISAEDDRFGTAATARQIVKIVPHAELVIFPDGGHIWLGHDEAIAKLMHSFVSVRR